MATTRSQTEQHPRWIIALAILVCLASIGAMIVALANDRYVEALGFLIVAILGALLPRIRNFVIQISLRDQSASAAVNAPPDGQLEDRGASQQPAQADEPR